MGCRLLCCVALCLLQAGSLDTAVPQTPKYLVTQTGKEESVKCEQNLGHDAMYWYKQDSKKLLKIMFSYNNKQLFINETVSNRFSPDSPDKARLILHIKSLELGDSAVYFCASSQDTTLQSHRIPVHKPPGSARKLWASVCTCTQGSSLHCLMASDGVSVCSTAVDQERHNKKVSSQQSQKKIVGSKIVKDESDPTDTGITQTPKYLVTGMGSKRTLKYEQHLGHDSFSRLCLHVVALQPEDTAAKTQPCRIIASLCDRNPWGQRVQQSLNTWFSIP
ncbi:PREDICTED: uncharacterized protein LOC105533563 [Mandrillus leucophaeus]|uniref:uncharacterized protein LOC105533563 n=1 Tax=Mandrillus leucophaeus TaxID=9568 RepID=UPI0005F57BDF|nr:PREDICTED: uncharacterized protein LOC105533563 [Mandrillus leucophaeus]